MNKLIFKMFLCGLLSFSSGVFANNAIEENFCAELKGAKAEMQETLSKIQQKKVNDSALLTALSHSQKQWTKYVDAELVMQFPSQSFIEYGSVLPMCQCVTRLGLTQERIASLKQWIEPVEEGDVCVGSKR
ncbi:lysozyme inhibitor LprI family protein [uncultured Limnobacter sp.]|uniref:lysozyme inhibitor LprI family protein n=1 Tax=uncultured Limnobacter sp. TaxID=199681 RepID=UPI0030FB4441